MKWLKKLGLALASLVLLLFVVSLFLPSKWRVERSVVIASLIGAAGGFVGGSLVAPMFLAAATAPAAFSMPALFFAGAVAAGFVFLGNLVSDRWGV